MDSFSLKTVAEDLSFLASWNSNIRDAEIRRGSATLRRLLVEDAYGIAWRAIGNAKAPQLWAVEITRILDGVPMHQVNFALAWGVSLQGFDLVAQTAIRGPVPERNLVLSHRKGTGYPGEREYQLSEFLSSISGVVNGKTFTRREVIKYIANVKGGVHLGTKERKAERKLIERLGEIDQKVTAFKTDGLLIELVAIAQAVGKSDDAQKLIREIGAKGSN